MSFADRGNMVLGFVIKKITNNGPLTRNEARAVEQVIIERNPHFENKINSISPDSEYYDGALEWGLKWLAEHVGSGQF